MDFYKVSELTGVEFGFRSRFIIGSPGISTTGLISWLLVTAVGPIQFLHGTKLNIEWLNFIASMDK